RVMTRTLPGRMHGAIERLGNRAFGRWAARVVPRESWDCVLAFSGVAEDLFRQLENTPTFRVLQRASAHIRSQGQLLEEEERRAGCWVEKPSDWIVAREECEYAVADAIFVVARFALESCAEQGVELDKLFLLPLGVNTAAFRASEAVVEARCRRI